ncbi:MAG: methyltransferase domain-containing protein [Planctomycetales bacterium]|nr:methyltransferase domain-containing protein [Planctomycetales bacterium]
MTTTPLCRFCQNELNTTFVDLGMSPLCQTQIKPDQLNAMERFFPLHTYVCEHCWLVQLEEFVAPSEIFSADYPYFSSFSESWVQHAERYCELILSDYGLSKDSLIVELASNDGYLLQHFKNRGYEVLGIEPAVEASKAAEKKGIPSINRFFGRETAHWLVENFRKANLIVGNNVLAHVPDINDFVGGMKILLADDGLITMEFPHLLQLIDKNQFDTIYHEHFSYLSLAFVKQLFEHHEMKIIHVDELSTHGGSLRIYAAHADSTRQTSDAPTQILKGEEEFGLTRLARYEAFSERVQQTKRSILAFLISAREHGKKVVGYGAPGKGNTLLNYCGIRQDFLDFTVDLNPSKYGTYTPGTHIPILHPDQIREAKPDFLFILPWNLSKEIIGQTQYIRDWGGKWVTPIPNVRVWTDASSPVDWLPNQSG